MKSFITLSLLLLLGLFSLVKVDAKSCPGGVTDEVQRGILRVKEAEGAIGTGDGCSLDSDELVNLGQVHVIEENLPQNRRRESEGARNKRKTLDFSKLPAGMQWDITAIPYGIGQQFTDDQRENIRSALDHIASETCFSFEENKENPSLFFEWGKSCLSYLGREDKRPHRIFLNAECANKAGEVIHQVLHALGMCHEHQREDRDEYVTVNKENIKNGEDGGFTILWGLIVKIPFIYDYSSIMHFASVQYANITGEVVHTLEPTGPPELVKWKQRTMGQRVEMSFQDAFQLNFFYCIGNCFFEPRLLCENAGYMDPTDCSRCKCPHGFSGDLCEVVAAEQGEEGKVCGGKVEITRDKKSVTSPGYDDDESYEPLTDCTWLLTSPEGSVVNMNFEGDFAVYARGPGQTCYHWVEIRSEGDLANPGIRFCGSETPDIQLNSTTNKVLVLFKSLWEDADEEDRRGFKLTAWTDAPDPCDSVVCGNGGTCVAGTCECGPGYYGDTCNLEDKCYQKPCQNGGTCRIDENEAGFVCECDERFLGDDCERENNCHENPCQNGGSCLLAENEAGFLCSCHERFLGEKCDRENFCYDEPCVNGDCLQIEGGFQCLCGAGYTGPICGDEVIASACDQHECKNGGTCVEDETAPSGYTCNCLAGFQGEHCTRPCGGCETQADHLFKEVEPCYDTIEEDEQYCRYVRMSYTTSSGRIGYKRVPRWYTRTVKKQVQSCGCNGKLMNRPKKTCAMTGLGKWSDCTCVCGSCKNIRYTFDVTSSSGCQWYKIAKVDLRDCSGCRSCSEYSSQRENRCLSEMFKSPMSVSDCDDK